MDLLARREHSQLELARKLQAREFPSDLINSVIEELKTENLQSDTRFTENYIRSRANKGFGPLRIQAELRERGISEPDLNINAEIWSDNAKAAFIKKFGSNPPQDAANKAKQIRFLHQRGFTQDQIRFVMLS